MSGDAAGTAPLALREPDADERARMVDLWVAAWSATFPQLDFEARREWLRARLAALEADGARLLAAFEGDAALGFVTIDSRTQWLDQLCVHPDAFGKGVARALLEAARELSPSGVRLDVNADNPRALRFYEREGFVKTGEGRNPNSGLRTIALEWVDPQPPR